MKNFSYNWIISVLILSTSLSFGQDLDKENTVVNADQEKFITLLQIDDAVSQSATNASTIVQGVNSVFIRQIGNDNTVVSRVTTESSDIKILQNGNKNSVEIEEVSRETEKLITQSGDNNSIVDFSFNPNQSTKLELIQEGNNLIFERFGTNELSQSLKFKMTGDSKTIIVRSF